MQKMKTSVSKKLFFITFGLLLSLMLITMLFQSLFFETFYLKTRIKDLTSEVSKFSMLYSGQYHNEDSLYRALDAFEKNTNTKIAICSLNGKLRYLTDIKKGVDNLDGISEIYKSLLNDEALINDVIENDETRATVYQIGSTGDTKIGIVAPMSLSTKNDSVIMCVSSIQPITEASTVIKEFYSYLLIGLLLMGVVMTTVYTNLITKPLLKINKVAERMSAMDFSEKCAVNTKDEIGNLGETLNFLSSNLDSALNDLKQKNYKLQEDIEKERKLETLRKDFVASVSHELKTPIGIIEGYAEGIKDGVVSGNDVNNYLDTIIDESKKMGLLVTTMLELSKLESGTVELNIQEFNILRLLQKILSSLTISFESKNLSVNFDSSLPYAYVEADSFQIDQVLTNLLTNAYKYSPENADININISELDEKIVISIENTGVSIPQEELQNIYQKFYRLDKSGNRSTNSTGLGLAIVQRILNLHNSIYSMSNTPVGVKFEFSLNKANIE